MRRESLWLSAKRTSHRGHSDHRAGEPKLGVLCALCGSPDLLFALVACLLSSVSCLS